MVPGRVSRSRICFSRFIVTGRVSPFLLVPGSVSSVSWLRTCFSCLMVPGRVSTVSLLQGVFFLSYGSRMCFSYLMVLLCFSCLMVPGCVSPVSWFQDVFLLTPYTCKILCGGSKVYNVSTQVWTHKEPFNSILLLRLESILLYLASFFSLVYVTPYVWIQGSREDEGGGHL